MAISYQGKVLIIGCGAVAQCFLPLLLKNIRLSPKQITIIDTNDKKKHAISSFIQQGMHYFTDPITAANYPNLLNKYLKSGDLCIDLASNVDTYDIVDWCFKHNVHYLNTAINDWPSKKAPSFRLYEKYKTTLSYVKEKNQNCATSILSHGANPGLISSLAKQALLDIGEKIIHEKPRDDRSKKIELAIENKDFKALASLEKIKVIHVSEIDTQVSRTKRPALEFRNTWSIPEFVFESSQQAEWSWGNHECNLPDNTLYATQDKDIVFSNILAMHTKLKSWVHDKEIIGIIPPHDEQYSIADYLTIKNNENKIIYRPTIVFVYSPCSEAQESLQELETFDFNFQNAHIMKIMNNDVTYGNDNLGALLMGHDFKSWWTGSVLSIEKSNILAPCHNATVLQVAIGAVAATAYILAHSKKGILLPEDLDHEFILNVAKPYLGDYVSHAIDWEPKKNSTWTFNDFLI